MAKWKVPNKLRVGGADYRVSFVPDLKNNLGQELYGMHQRDQREIKLNSSIPVHPSHLKETLFHEVLHAIWDHMNLPNEAKEEDVVMAFQTGLIMFFKDNPKLLEVLK